MGTVRALALLVVPLLLAGCTELPERLGSFGGASDSVPLPYYQEYQEEVLPQHERAYPVPVSERAERLNASLALTMRDSGAGLPGSPPAAVAMELLDPTGAVVARAEANPQRPTASIVFEDFASSGTYTLRVTGVGASQTVDGVRYGAAYSLAVEVVHR